MLDDIKSGRISQTKAAKKLEISRNALRNKFKDLHTKNVGKPIVFSKEEELAFVEHAVSLSDIGIPISLFDLRRIVKSYSDVQNRNVSQFKGNLQDGTGVNHFLNAIKMLQLKNLKPILFENVHK